jgi:regulator of protease activity HflC (stomatin/prohibitin superfamily)
MFTSVLRGEIAKVGSDAQTRLVPGQDIVKQVMDTAGGAYVRLRRDRMELNQKIEKHITARMGEEYGIRFLGIDLTEVIPPEELASALNAVQNAKAEISAQYSRVEAECQQRLASAERNVTIAETRAKAVETEILTMAGALDQLEQTGSLNSYLQRRRDEVSGEAKLSYIRGGNA